MASRVIRSYCRQASSITALYVGTDGAILALALLMARVRANDKHHASTADNLAIFANSLDACTDFHASTSPLCSCGRKRISISACPPSVQPLLVRNLWAWHKSFYAARKWPEIAQKIG